MPFYILLLRPDVQQFELIKFARHPEKIPSGKILLEQTLKAASHPAFLAQDHAGFYCLATKTQLLLADDEKEERKSTKKIQKTASKKNNKKKKEQSPCVSKEDEDEENTEQQKKIVHHEEENSTIHKTEKDKERTPNPPEQQQQPEPDDADDRLLALLLEDDAGDEDGNPTAEDVATSEQDAQQEVEEEETTDTETATQQQEQQEEEEEAESPTSAAANEDQETEEEPPPHDRVVAETAAAGEDHAVDNEESEDTEDEEEHNPFATMGPILVAIPTGVPIQQVDTMSRLIMASSSFQILTTGDDILNKIENTSTTQQELEELHRLAKTKTGTEQFIAQHITANAKSNEAYEQQVQDLEDRRKTGSTTRRSSSSSFASTTGSPRSHGVGAWEGAAAFHVSSLTTSRTSIVVSPPSVSRPDTHGLSPVDALRVAQNQQRILARQHEHATKQHYQHFNSSASHSFGSSSSKLPSPRTAVTPPSSFKSVITIDTETPSIQSSSSRVRKQALDAQKEHELKLVRQARRDGAEPTQQYTMGPNGDGASRTGTTSSSTKSCTSFGSASFSESSEHKLVRSFWKSPGFFVFLFFFFRCGVSPKLLFAIVFFFFLTELCPVPLFLCFVGLGGLV